MDEGETKEGRKERKREESRTKWGGKVEGRERGSKGPRGVHEE